MIRTFSPLALLLIGTLVPTVEASSKDDIAKALRGTESERLEALDALAEAALETAPPSKDLARKIVASLDDKYLSVQVRAIELLGKGQHPDIAVPALTRVLEDIRSDLSKLPKNRGRTEREKEMLRTVAKRSEAVTKALAGLRDDRVVKALTDFISRAPDSTNDRLRIAVARAITDIGARKGIQALIKVLPQIAARDNSREGRGRGRTGRLGRQVHDLLVKSGRSLGHDDMPAKWSKEAPADWRGWFSKHDKDYPAKVGRLKADS